MITFSRVKRCAQVLCQGVLAVALAGALMPWAASEVAQAASVSTPADKAAHIESLLAAGEYVEGEVLVVLAKDASHPRSTPALFQPRSQVHTAAFADDLLAAAEPLMDVSSRVYTAATDPTSDEASLSNDAKDTSDATTPGGSDGAFDPNDASVAESAGVALAFGAGERPKASLSAAEPATTLSFNPTLLPYQAFNSRTLDQPSSDDESLSIVLIQKQGVSTKSLLETFQDDPRVLYVQPNYVHSLEDSTPSEGLHLEGADARNTNSSDVSPTKSPSLPQQASAPARDLTSFQWGNNNTATTSVDQSAPALAGFDVNPPQWNEQGQTNASGVVAVVDTGVDYRNPDLAGVMCDMTPYSSRGGRYGFRSAAGGDPRDPMDNYGHGTHVAGIIAGAWDGHGISGVVSGARVVAVRVADAQNRQSDSSVIKGYDYLSEAIDNGLPLKAINDSWGSPNMSAVIKMAITKLGQKGAISVFASGNSAENVDKNPESVASFLDSPYVVVVDSANSQGKLSIFSNYGVETTDVVAPGEQILSTVPLDQKSYLAQADPSPIAFESFSKANPQVTAYKDVQKSEEVGSVVSGESHFDDQGGALKIPLEGLSAPDPLIKPEQADDVKSMILHIKIDKPAQSEVHFLNLNALFSTSGNDGLAIQFKVKGDTGDGWTSAKSGSASVRKGWLSLSEDVDALVAASGGQLDFADDGSLVARILLARRGAVFGKGDCLFLDTVGVGRTGAEVPYGYKSGTSMAAPVVVGVAAILSQRIDQSMSAPLRAAELAARVKASVRPMPDFADRCSSGGSVDLSYDTPEKRTPVLSSAQVLPVANTEQSVASSGADQLVIKGHFFGSAPATLMVAGIELPITTWSDTTIKASVVPELVSGVNRVGVRASNGHRGQKGFLLNFSPSSQNNPTPLFEKDIALPTQDQGFPSNVPYVMLAGLAGSPYLLPADNDDDGSDVYFSTMFRYDRDKQTWTRCADAPEHMNSVSLADFDGLLYAYATIGSQQETHAALYVYRPQSDSWEVVSIGDLPVGASLVNNDGELLLVGRENYDVTTGRWQPTKDDAIVRLDTQSGQMQVVGSLREPLVQPEVVSRQGTLYLTDAQSFEMPTSENKEKGIFDTLTKQGDTYVDTDISDTLPKRDTSYDLHFNLGVGKQGVVALNYKGALEEGKQVDQDSYLLDLASGKTSFEGLGKRISRACLFNTSALAYDGWLYGFGFSAYEPHGVVLRATAFDTLPTPGDALAPNPAPSPVQPDSPSAQANPSTPSMASSAQKQALPLTATGDALIVMILGLIGTSLLAGAVLLAVRVRAHRD